MADYKKMYLALFRATEKAINILEAAQLECEELYISAPEPEITLMDTLKDSDTDSGSAR